MCSATIIKFKLILGSVVIANAPTRIEKVNAIQILTQNKIKNETLQVEHNQIK